ncbi:GTP 3',8-cyclase MoaA [Devosia sp.]|uniref:GTP 3',8-cyclase MoaA n=1 Tax=Devosia sp. TaxID=1871048 RepID=UPI001ACE50D5|nr:GTP 3',8-cyclase MoaA [Devosia sp.]MBN9310777.1 GTP 3',8-cyclase MoaA [Devosia sp.]
MTSPLQPLVDGFGRPVTYLRLSVTDRCDLRCTYCMPEQMRFAPGRDRLDVAGLYGIAGAFIAGGVRKIRLTGGEPLVRKDLPALLERLSDNLSRGELDEVTVSSNGSQLSRMARTLARHGVRRVNVSLDTLDPDQYREITRGGVLADVLEGIEAALAEGLRIRINTVALLGVVEDQFEPLLRYAHGRGMALALIETMPLGDTGVSRIGQYLSLTAFRRELEQRWTLSASTAKSGGPASYVTVGETGGLLGFITPLSCNFCASCNRVRVGSDGRLFTCMGHEGSVDLRPALAAGADGSALDGLIREALRRKPERHGFEVGKAALAGGIVRHMSVLGG